MRPNGGSVATDYGGSKWSLEVSVDQWSEICITLIRTRIRIRIKVKSWIRTRIRIKFLNIIVQEHAADTQFPRGEDDRSPGP
jgi:hypothetical protein